MECAGCEVGGARAFPFAFAAIVVVGVVAAFIEEVGGGPLGTGVFLSVHHLEYCCLVDSMSILCILSPWSLSLVLISGFEFLAIVAKAGVLLGTNIRSGYLLRRSCTMHDPISMSRRAP